MEEATGPQWWDLVIVAATIVTAAATAWVPWHAWRERRRAHIDAHFYEALDRSTERFLAGRTHFLELANVGRGVATNIEVNWPEFISTSSQPPTELQPGQAVRLHYLRADFETLDGATVSWTDKRRSRQTVTVHPEAYAAP